MIILIMIMGSIQIMTLNFIMTMLTVMFKISKLKRITLAKK